MSKEFLASFIFIFSFFTQFISSQIPSDLVIEPGFEINIFADDLDSPRQMAEGSNGTIFLGQRSGQILALLDSDRNGQVDARRVIASNLTYSTGVSIFDGDLYFCIKAAITLSFLDRYFFALFQYLGILLMSSR